MSKVNTAQASDPAYAQPVPSREPVQAQTPPPAQDQPDVRLVIEEDEATGAFVYKTMDRRTGEVIQQFPREQLLHLKETQEYAAGAIVNARA